MNEFLQKLNQNASKKGSYLCIGLDTDYNKLPVKSSNIMRSMLDFNEMIIRHTYDAASCYKINSAFYEKYGEKGIEILKKTIDLIKKKDIPVILDAKRGDIENSSKYYAEYAFNYLGSDAITVLPYMGIDSMEPFFKYDDKFVFAVVLSSNPGGADFQLYPFYNPLYERVIKKINQNFDNAGFVFGATKPEYIKKIRQKKITNPLLIPGLGAQGGDIEKTKRYTFLNGGIGIFNISRGIIYAGQGKKYYLAVREKAIEYNNILKISI